MGGDLAKPVAAMVVVQVMSAGVNIFYKLAVLDGMDMRVLVAYRYLFASAFLAPLAYFIERYAGVAAPASGCMDDGRPIQFQSMHGCLACNSSSSPAPGRPCIHPSIPGCLCRPFYLKEAKGKSEMEDGDGNLVAVAPAAAVRSIH